MAQTAAAAEAAAPRTKASFQWDDPFLLDDQLGEEERLVRDTTRAYAQEKLMPRILEANRHERFDRRIMDEMGALGLLGSTIQGYGAPASATSATAWRRGRSRQSIPATARR